ncbi:MAG: tRNA (adenosine(37)-N6)-threonylcarbamoyltransferase complex dimerization subunit type 1 TsaB [Bryobacteraceae bacterium]
MSETRILAIDTTAEFGSIALGEGGAVVDEVLLHSPEGFGQILFPQVEQLLARRQWRLQDIDCFAGMAGPGSFTGVRIGLTAVKGLAEAAGKPAVGVSNLRALAWFGTAAQRAVVLDARRGEVYGAVYDDRLDLVSDEVVTKFPAWLASLPEGNLEFIFTDPSLFAPALAGTRFADAAITAAPRALAGAAACIAARALALGLATDPVALDANYVRRSDAELLWKDR